MDNRIDNDRIQEGDIVGVQLDDMGNNWYPHMKVLGMPQDTGDAWRLRGKDGWLIYVQTYSVIILESKVSKA